MACKPGLQASAIRKASFHADHPPMCLKMLCKCTKLQYCNASLCKKVRHYFRHYFVLFTFSSMLSFLFYYVNVPKGELLVNLCVSILIDWGRVMRICVGNLTIIGSDNCLSPGRRHAIVWTDAGIVNWTLENRFQWNYTFSFKKIWKCPLIARFMGPTLARLAPGGPHELCYLGRQEDGGHFVLASMC